ncbi:hypothetical protein XFF6166_170025 [Xanthomonas citri pv. fuscans]|nr:hypothetical protein XFF6166_170025 [Xanthomonas citri pv. fuscans]SOO00467.1 hypothetical protein XFF6960_310047 [Xanthomonas citri pv. fuscans]SOO43116.1 hypothetical protein XFF1815_310045 [Xanthomonas citri pv. fuscans]
MVPSRAALRARCAARQPPPRCPMWTKQGCPGRTQGPPKRSCSACAAEQRPMHACTCSISCSCNAMRSPLRCIGNCTPRATKIRSARPSPRRCRRCRRSRRRAMPNASAHGSASYCRRHCKPRDLAVSASARRLALAESLNTQRGLELIGASPQRQQPAHRQHRSQSQRRRADSAAAAPQLRSGLSAADNPAARPPGTGGWYSGPVSSRHPRHALCA